MRAMPPVLWWGLGGVLAGYWLLAPTWYAAVHPLYTPAFQDHDDDPPMQQSHQPQQVQSAGIDSSETAATSSKWPATAVTAAPDTVHTTATVHAGYSGVTHQRRGSGENAPVVASRSQGAKLRSVKQGSIGPFNLDQRAGLRNAIRSHGRDGEIALFTSNQGGLLNAANMALQLQALGISHHLVLADQRRTCTHGLAAWPWLGCGWSRGLVGFEKRYGESEMVRLWSLWSVRSAPFPVWQSPHVFFSTYSIGAYSD